MNKMAKKDLHEIVSVRTEVSDKPESVLELALLGVADNRTKQMTDKFGEYPVDSIEYAVTIQPVTEEGKPKAEPRTASSRVSYDEALAQATDNGNVKVDGEIKLVVVQKFKVPYELERIHIEGREKRVVLEQVASQEKTLRRRYVSLMGEAPYEAAFSVWHYSGKWGGKKARTPVGKVLAEGKSDKSLEEAYDAAQKLLGTRASQASLFEATLVYKVYQAAAATGGVVEQAKGVLATAAGAVKDAGKAVVGAVARHTTGTRQEGQGKIWTPSRKVATAGAGMTSAARPAAYETAQRRYTNVF